MWLIIFSFKIDNYNHIFDELHIRYEIATSPLEREKWGRSVDLIAAARLFNFNIFTVQFNPTNLPGQPRFKWKVHSPKCRQDDPNNLTERVIYV